MMTKTEHINNDIPLYTNKCLIYIHGMGGNPDEAEHYKTLFTEYDVIGLSYAAQTPWEAQVEFPHLFTDVTQKYNTIIVVASSIGAFFALHSLNNIKITEAFLISPIVNMEGLIKNMMNTAGVSETELRQKENIQTKQGATLSWQYLEWVRNHPVIRNAPTHVLYGGHDHLQTPDDIKNFAAGYGADVTVMENGEHWFHTKEQMDFLDNWLTSRLL